MNAYIKELKNKAGDRIYPVTRADAVYAPNGTTKLVDFLNEYIEGSSVTTFTNNGSIVKTFSSGMVSTTTFTNNVITEVCVDGEGSEIYTKTTTLNNDGSINTEVVYATEGE